MKFAELDWGDYFHHNNHEYRKHDNHRAIPVSYEGILQDFGHDWVVEKSDRPRDVISVYKTLKELEGKGHNSYYRSSYDMKICPMCNVSLAKDGKHSKYCKLELMIKFFKKYDISLEE